MEAVIVNFRRGLHRQNTSQIILKVEGVKSKDLIKKTATWKSPSGKEIKGVITSKHGNKDCVRAKFERGLPGQAIGKKVVIS